MATTKDIAKKLGVSMSTVSKGLNGASDISEEMRQLVLQTAAEMGYASKRARKAHRRKVCVLAENMNQQNLDQFEYEILVGFKMAAEKKNYEVTVIPTNSSMQSEERYDRYMLKNDYCGAFLLGFSLRDDYVRQLEHTQFPTVLLDNYIDNKHVGYVGTDSIDGIRSAIDYLAQNGHKKIAFLNGSRESLISEERYQAFIMAMNANQLEADTDLIRYGSNSPDCARIYVTGFVQKGATAIFCASDLIASGVLAELNRLGKQVPEEISVVGYDDLPLARYLFPSLTTIRQDRITLGKSAFVLMEELINGISVSKILLRSEFIIRNSSCACAALPSKFIIRGTSGPVIKPPPKIIRNSSIPTVSPLPPLKDF